MLAYATVDEYREETGDYTSECGRVKALLEQQSAKLRACANITEDFDLSDDQQTLAHFLIIDAVRKSLVSPSFDFEGVDATGTTQGSFSANGFQQSYTLQNPSGSAYFDRDTLKAFLRTLKGSQKIGSIYPCFGR